MSSPSVHNLVYLESLYARYRLDPQSVPADWRGYFDTLSNGTIDSIVQLGPSFKPGSIFGGAIPSPGTQHRFDSREEGFNDRLNELIRNYRVRGHTIAEIDPLGTPRPCPQELQLDYYGFTRRELDLLTNSATLPGDAPRTIREIFGSLRNTYCRSIGVQFMHLDDVAARGWLQRRMEGKQNRLELSRDEQLRILTRLTDAVIFEEFLRKKFIGAKTFSLEGSETLLPMLDLAIEKAGDQGVRRMVIGMAHRGRLNVLAHIVGKDPCEIFREFADAEPEHWEGRGDVKHHLGHSGDWTTAGGHKVHLSLCFNPSHLEFVNPVVLGRVRAQQDRLGDRDRRQVLALLIHGDAAFAGEGIVQETLTLSKLAGYSVGGALHVVINNQIGFTTAPDEGRSTPYTTDVARMLQAPIFHVNGEDPEAVAQVVRLAMDFRNEFLTDVFIDMYGYRRWGHNETDEPSFTQPVLYRAIGQRPSVRDGYLKHLLELNGVTGEEADQIAQARREKLEQNLVIAGSDKCAQAPRDQGVWRDYSGGQEPGDDPDTGVNTKRLATLLRKLTEMPDGFHLHSKLERGMNARRAMAEGQQALDWSAAEALALATLATAGVRIRLTGQDTGRGTFSHRHAVLHDQKDGLPYLPLQHVADDQAPVEIHNSPLSEAGALGFEYGYSLDTPDGLVIWEAQFGDFVNAAQVVLDQFLTSAEDKWRRLSGLVLLLPHGFEGVGPEHSSARIERFLTLAAEDNIQIVQPTTPAQYFHLLRRQALRRWRKPLIVFTPKSLLRHPKVVSSLDDFTRGCFQRVLPDGSEPHAARRVLLCTGKVFYELTSGREEHKREDIAIIRLEQLYPLPSEQLAKALKSHADNTPVFWVQEEPANMGAWRYLHEKIGERLFDRHPFGLVSRPESASPATGSARAHKMEQEKLVHRAFGGDETPPATHAVRTEAKKGTHHAH
jgi:2-oxoglutarate dehydrogenase E1 component